MRTGDVAWTDRARTPWPSSSRRRCAIPTQIRVQTVTPPPCAVTARRGTFRVVNAAQTWTLVGTVVALSTALVSVIIAFMTTRFAMIDQRFTTIDRRFDEMDRRFDRVEGVITGLDRDVQTLTRHVLGDGTGST